MRIVTVNGRDIEIRSLTGKEIKLLKKYGYGPVLYLPEYETVNESVDVAVELVLSESDLDHVESCPASEKIRVWEAIKDETYGNQDEEKNSQGTSDGTLTANESTTAKISVVPGKSSPKNA